MFLLDSSDLVGGPLDDASLSCFRRLAIAILTFFLAVKETFIYYHHIVSKSPNRIIVDANYTPRCTLVLVLVLVIDNSVVNPILHSSTWHSSKLLVFVADAMLSSSFSTTSSITDSSSLPAFCAIVLSQEKHVLHPMCFNDSRCLAIMRLATSSRRLVVFS